VKNGFRTY